MPARYGEAGLGSQPHRRADTSLKRLDPRRIGFDAADHGWGGGQCSRAMPGGALGPAEQGPGRSADGIGLKQLRYGRTFAPPYDLEKTEPVYRSALERLRQNRVESSGGGLPLGFRWHGWKVDPDRSSDPEAANCSARRLGARKRKCGRGERAVDVEQGHGRGDAHPKRAAGEWDLTGQRLFQQLGPASLLQPVRLSGTAADDPLACRFDALEQ
jgi:hypothetical protein